VADVAEMGGLDVDAGFWRNDKCCYSGFGFRRFAFFWEKKLPYGFNLYSVCFGVVFE